MTQPGQVRSSAGAGLSSGSGSPWVHTAPTGRRVGEATVFDLVRTPGTPPIGVGRLVAERLPHGALRHLPHAHDFLVLAYFDRGGGRLRLDGRTWQPRTGDLFVIAPHEVVDPGDDPDWAGISAWTVFFPVDVVDARAGNGLPWRAHPLLFPFVGSRAGGVQRLQVPEAERAEWSRRFAELDRELTGRREGFAVAARALLTLLLIELSRLAADVVDHQQGEDQPLLAAVFDVIEQRYAEPLSLRDVARAVGLSPGHLTTVVGRRTGRTVQQWITERRMSEARRLLAGTTLSVAAIARRTGYPDDGYFVRRFRAAHGMPPGEWRRSA